MELQVGKGEKGSWHGWAVFLFSGLRACVWESWPPYPYSGGFTLSGPDASWEKLMGFLGWKRHSREKKCTALVDGKAMAPLFVTVELPTYLGLGQGLVLVLGEIYTVGITSPHLEFYEPRRMPWFYLKR